MAGGVEQLLVEEAIGRRTAGAEPGPHVLFELWMKLAVLVSWNQFGVPQPRARSPLPF